MDPDKIALFITKIGLVPAMLAWLAWEFHTFINQLITNQQQLSYLMQRLIDLHTR